MKLYKKQATSNNARGMSSIQQGNIIWKGDDNVKNTIVSKYVMNDPPKNNINSLIQNKFNAEGTGTSIEFIPNPLNRSQFKPNPIKHYRKQYTNVNSSVNNGFSKLSYIGSLDKPGTNIITQVSNNNCDNVYQTGVEYINEIDQDCNKFDNCMIIKPASTVINKKAEKYYCSTNKELLWKNCKTFNQNLPLYNNTSSNVHQDGDKQGTMTETACNNHYNKCLITYKPSNKKYMVQGAVSSSARIASIKYDNLNCNKGRCYLPTNKYPDNKNLDSIPSVLCRTSCDGTFKSYKSSNIRILK